VPRTHDEIYQTALSCYGVGASILHAHCSSISAHGADAAEDYLAAWRRVKKAKPDALWYPTLTTNGGDDLEHVMAIDQAIGLEYACVDPGTVGIAKLDEPGYLRTVIAYHAAGKLPAGAVVNFYFGGPHGVVPPGGLPFGLPPTRTALDAYLDMLGDADLPWTVSVWGGDILQTDLPSIAIQRGGHIQIGLESHFDPGATPTNEDQIAHIVNLAKAAGRPIADSVTTLQVWKSPRAD
jgi:uncharacterized protein (DUF849 family)